MGSGCGELGREVLSKVREYVVLPIVIVRNASARNGRKLTDRLFPCVVSLVFVSENRIFAENKVRRL